MADATTTIIGADLLHKIQYADGNIQPVNLPEVEQVLLEVQCNEFVGTIRYGQSNLSFAIRVCPLAASLGGGEMMGRYRHGSPSLKRW